MALQAIADPAGRIKLFGDVAFLFAVAIVLAAVMPQACLLSRPSVAPSRGLAPQTAKARHDGRCALSLSSGLTLRSRRAERRSG